MRKRTGILGMAALLLAGCYDDKGNYDYRDINEMISIKFDPAPDEITTDSVYTYSYPQSSQEVMQITYTPVVTQSMASDESLLEYQWIFVNEDGNDTIRSKELTLDYPFQEILTYNPLFRLIDHSTGVEYYKQFQMSTREPYLDSWYVLHGNPGDRRIGVAEISDDGEVIITEDAYETAFGVRRFQNATGMFYSAGNRMRMMMLEEDGEFLMVYERDSCTKLNPFMFLTRMTYPQMMPQNMPILPGIAGGVAVEGINIMGEGGGMLLSDVNGKCYWSNQTNGYFFTCKTTEVSANYHATMAYMPLSENGTMAIIWDEVNKKFWNYYFCSGASYFEELEAHPVDNAYDEGYNIEDFEITDQFEEGELDDKTAIVMLEGCSGTAGMTGIVFRDESEGEYYYYEVGMMVDDKGEGEEFTVIKHPLTGLNINEDSQFASSYAYTNQLFYTVGGDLYWVNLLDLSSARLLYSTSGTISKLKFALACNDAMGFYSGGLNDRLALAVNVNGQGELHDLRLSSGDVVDATVCTGFGPIEDVIFSMKIGF